AIKDPYKVNGSYNNHRYFESTYDASKHQAGTTYTMYVTTTDATNVFKDKEVLYLYRGVNGNIAGSNIISYDSSREIAKLKVLKIDKKGFTGDFKGASQSKNILSVDTLLAFGNPSKNEVINNVNFRVYLENQNGHIINQQAQSTKTSGGYGNYRYFTTKFDMSQAIEETTYTIKVLGLDPTTSVEIPSLLYLYEGKSGMIPGSLNIRYDNVGNIGKLSITQANKKSVMGDTKSIRQNGSQLKIELLIATVNGYGATEVIEGNQFKVSLVNEKNHVIQQVSGPRRLNGSYQNFRYYEVDFDVNSLQSNSTYTIKVEGINKSIYSSIPSNTYIWQGLRGNINGSNNIMYDTSNNIGKLRKK
ncbi:MAG: hypothetical protein ACRCTA_03380, partial [Bacilli bacterium]